MARILLVEDEPWLGELYQRWLRRAGHQVDWRRDGYAAIDAAARLLPELIILDLLLPWVNGMQLLHELASHADLATSPIILYSNAIPQDFALSSLHHYGVQIVLDKATAPPPRLIEAVEQVLR